MIMYIAQAIYAGMKWHMTALKFDIAMVIGCALSFGIWFEMYWLLQVCFDMVFVANYYLAYQLRVKQNIPTKEYFIVCCIVAYVILIMFNVIGSLIACVGSGEGFAFSLHAVGYFGLIIM